MEVARIGRAHGLRGEVAVMFVSDRPERTEPGAAL
ncbi:MAG TPA: ribosome maturation factor RimM, partial [Acidimicrobiia bacterium]|nr:ribosome maturation factor RimM [Acidimicrobiia bacterium]